MTGYPLRFPDDDPRFSPALIGDIANVLKSYGYPSAIEDAATIDSLREALRGFLYGPAFNSGDKVAWVSDGKVYNGKVEYVATGDNGPVARIDADPQPGNMYRFTAVMPCRRLTLVPGGAQ